jgi:hypothetical protein
MMLEMDALKQPLFVSRAAHLVLRGLNFAKIILKIICEQVFLWIRFAAPAALDLPLLRTF